jgi:hypothetical protein
VNRIILVVSLAACAGLSAGTARADLIRNTFDAGDSATGAAVLGSFAYQTDAVGRLGSLGVTFFEDVHGSLTITAAGQTYSTNAVAGEVSLNGLTLFSDTGRAVLVLELGSPYNGPLFTGISSLPTTLTPGALGGSLFRLDVRPASGTSGPDVLFTGPITSIDGVTTAAQTPEPGGLLLTVLGGLILASRLVARGPT